MWTSRASRTLATAFFVGTAVLGAIPPAGAVDLTLPNLSPGPPHKIFVTTPVPADDPTGPRSEHVLRFAVIAYNLGEYPLEVLMAPLAVEEVDESARVARQCIQPAGPVCVEYREIGPAARRASYGDLGVEDYASYDLLPTTDDGLPDFAAAPLAHAVNQSHCLTNYRQAPGASQTASDATFHYCHNYRQGISPGFGAYHTTSTPGQQLVIDGVSPGTYALVVTINPRGRLFEVTSSDNRSWAVFTLGPSGPDNYLPVLRDGVS